MIRRLTAGAAMLVMLAACTTDEPPVVPAPTQPVNTSDAPSPTRPATPSAAPSSSASSSSTTAMTGPTTADEPTYEPTVDLATLVTRDPRGLGDNLVLARGDSGVPSACSTALGVGEKEVRRREEQNVGFVVYFECAKDGDVAYGAARLLPEDATLEDALRAYLVGTTKKEREAGFQPGSDPAMAELPFRVAMVDDVIVVDFDPKAPTSLYGSGAGLKGLEANLVRTTGTRGVSVFVGGRPSCLQMTSCT